MTKRKFEEISGHNNYDENQPFLKKARLFLDKKNDVEKSLLYGSKNLCEICKIDMGDCNPRQLCGKTYCENSASSSF